MDEISMRGQWREVRDRVREQWTTLTDEDLRRIEGQLLALQKRFGGDMDPAVREAPRGR